MTRASLGDCLPEVFAAAGVAGSPLSALVAAADGMQHPVADVLDHLDAYVDPYRTPPRMVAYLASWVDLDWLTLPDPDGTARSSLPLGEVPLRDLVSARAELSAARGTAVGLVRFLELATRATGFAVEDAGRFHLRVHVPETAAGQRGTVERIVRAMKPAHVTAEVVIAEVVPVGADAPAPDHPIEPTRSTPS